MTAALFYSLSISHTAGTSECHCLIKSLQMMKVMSSWILREKSFFIISCFSEFQVSAHLVALLLKFGVHLRNLFQF